MRIPMAERRTRRPDHEQLRTRGGRQEHLPRAPDFDMLDHRHVGKPLAPGGERLLQCLLLERFQPPCLVGQVHRTRAVGEDGRQTPGPHRSHRGSPYSRGLEGESQHRVAVLRPALLPHDDLSAVRLARVPCVGPDRDHGTRGGSDHLLTVRAEHEADESAVPP